MSPPASLRGTQASQQPTPSPTGRGIVDARVGKLPRFSGDENTWGDWSFKLRSHDTRECVATRCIGEPRHGRAVQVSGRHLDQRTRCRSSGNSCTRRQNQRSQALSVTQLQELMNFEFGQEPAGVTDRLIVGDCETSSGELLGVHVKCAGLLERVPLELRTDLLLACGSRPDFAP